MAGLLEAIAKGACTAFRKSKAYTDKQIGTIEKKLNDASNSVIDIKGQAFGSIVYLDDVTPLPSKVKVNITSETLGHGEDVTIKTCGLNLADISKGVNANLVDNGDGTFTFTKIGNSRFSGSIPIYIPANKAFNMSAKILENTSLSPDAIQLRFTNSEGEAGYGTLTKNGMQGALTKTATAVQIYLQHTDADGAHIKLSEFQITFGSSKKAYEPYIEGETVSTSIGETVELASIAPIMTIATDKGGALISAEYIKDPNITIEKLTNALISLGGNI